MENNKLTHGKRGFKGDFNYEWAYIGSSLPAGYHVLRDKGFKPSFNISQGKDGIYCERQQRLSNASGYMTHMHAPGVPCHFLFSCIWQIHAATTATNYWPTSGEHAGKSKPFRMHRVHNEQWVQSEYTTARHSLFIHAVNAYEVAEQKGNIRVHHGTANALCHAPECHYKDEVIPDARVLFRRPYLPDNNGIGKKPLAKDRLLEQSEMAEQGFSLPHWQYKGMWGRHNMPKED